nr:glycosyltransferase family 4 protein [Motilibacter deserti]
MARSGSGITNVVRGLAAAHERAGGRSTVVLSHNRPGTVRHARVERVDYTAHCPRESFRRTEYLLDHMLGALGRERRFAPGLFDPAVERLRALGPDVALLHEGHYAATALPRLRAALPTARLGYYVHTRLSRAYSRREVRRLLAPADSIVCVSAYTAQHVVDRHGGSPPEVSVVLNGVDTQVFSPPAHRQPHERLRLLFVGQVTAEKGPHLLLEAVAMLPEHVQRRLSLRVVGSSAHGWVPELSAYEERLRRTAFTLAADVRFLPFQDNETLVEHYRWADVVAVPSLFQDPCPLVVLEAMACGAAVVASRVGGIPELVGSAGLLLPAAPDPFAAALEHLMRDRPEVARLSARSVARAGELDWDSRNDEVLRALRVASPRGSR